MRSAWPVCVLFGISPNLHRFVQLDRIQGTAVRHRELSTSPRLASKHETIGSRDPKN